MGVCLLWIRLETLQNDGSEVITDRREYPWDGHWVRQDDEEFQGQIYELTSLEVEEIIWELQVT